MAFARAYQQFRSAHSAQHLSLSSIDWIFRVLFCATLAGCASTQPAPVIERAADSQKSLSAKKRAPKEVDWRPDVYVVQKGDTLYSIALEHGLDYREVADWNNLSDPNVIMIGRRLKLKAPASRQVAQTAPLQPAVENRANPVDGMLKTQPKPGKQPYTEPAAMVAAEVPPAAEKPVKAEEKQPVVEAKESATADDDEQIDWGWPTTGKLLSAFGDGKNAKGIDIAGKQGQAVLAAASGKVVYSGSGLRGYGKLIIIKHNKTYLSAYAHNSQILVKEGQNVAKGQRIAEMGDSDADQVKLHFEIRKLGKPVDPQKYLAATNEKAS